MDNSASSSWTFERIYVSYRNDPDKIKELIDFAKECDFQCPKDIEKETIQEMTEKKNYFLVLENFEKSICRKKMGEVLVHVKSNDTVILCGPERAIEWVKNTPKK
jgi:hypothetical protein